MLLWNVDLKHSAISITAAQMAMGVGNAAHAARECHMREARFLRYFAIRRRKCVRLPAGQEDVTKLQPLDPASSSGAPVPIVLVGMFGGERRMIGQSAARVELARQQNQLLHILEAPFGRLRSALAQHGAISCKVDQR